MRIKDIMTKRPVTVKPDDTFGKAVRLMTGRNISGCPVVKDGKLIGIVTQTDAVRAIDIYGKINRSDISSLLISILKSKDGDPARLRKLFKARVSDVMNRKVISVDVGRDVYEAARLMNKHGIDRLPVVKSSQLVGIVTKKDILRLLEKVNN